MLLKELYVRIFPTIQNEREDIRIIEEKNTILIKRHEKSKLKSNNLFLKFKTDGVFQNVSQYEIFNRIVNKDMLKRLYDELNLVIVAFGSFGTGKSYTMSGMPPGCQYRGIVPRLLEKIFLDKSKNGYLKEIKISLIYVEIDNGNIFNLMQPGKPKVIKQILPITVSTLMEALNCVSGGDSRRKKKGESHIGSTVLTIYIECSYKHFNRSFKQQSKINIVEIAGNSQVNVPNYLLKCHSEGNLTKSSLSTICCWAVNKFDKSVPGWRSSKLAAYLGNSLTNSYIRFIGHIKVTKVAILNTISTLEFANKLMKFPNPISVEAPPLSTAKDMYIKKLKNDIKETKESKIVNQIMNGLYMPELASKKEMQQAFTLVRAYLNKKVSESEVSADCNQMLFLNVFKQILSSSTKESQEKLDELILKINQQILKSGKKVRGPENKSVISLTSLTSRKKKKKKTEDTRSLALTDFNESSLENFIFEEKEKPDKAKLDEEVVHNGIISYREMYKEFLSRYPNCKLKLDSFEKEIAGFSCIRADILERFKGIKEELNKLNSNNEILNKIKQLSGSRIYRSIQTILEEKHTVLLNDIAVLEKQLEETRQIAISVHKDYILACQKEIKYVWEVQQQFIDYVLKVYSTSIVILPLDDIGDVEREH